MRKSIDSYAVIGPWLVTKDVIKDPNDVPFKLFVNGEMRHNAHTSDLIFNCQKLISLASEFYTLYPGDVIFTGASSQRTSIFAEAVASTRTQRRACSGEGVRRSSPMKRS